MREIILPRPTRVFVRAGEKGRQLCWSDQWLPAGTPLLVSDPEVMLYDHREQLTVQYQDTDGKERYLIIVETGILQLMQSVHN